MNPRYTHKDKIFSYKVTKIQIRKKKITLTYTCLILIAFARNKISLFPKSGAKYIHTHSLIHVHYGYQQEVMRVLLPKTLYEFVLRLGNWWKRY